jgi:hypothetical protein
MGMNWTLAVACLVPFALTAQRAEPQSSCANIPAYSPCELVFELPEADAAAHPNPYATVDLRVEFRSPRARTLPVPAFWDGSRRMVVRFAPNEAGRWDYHVTSNIRAWDDGGGSFTAAPSESRGFLRAANVHHWAYTERASTGLDQPHLWMGVNEMLFATMDEAEFRATVDARAAQKFNHLRGLVLAGAASGAYQPSGVPNIEYFKRLDARVSYLNQKGMVADLILAGGPGTLTSLFATPEQRRRFIGFLAGRYSAMNVTWHGVDQFEGYSDGRALLKEIGGYLKQLDPYQHPRTSGARITSSPLMDDGWMDFVTHASPDPNVNAVEHQIHGLPFVNVRFAREDSGAGKSAAGDVDAEAFRKQLWNAAMDGQYVTYENTGSGRQHLDSPGAKAMAVWFDVLSGTRYWELEPYFDVDGGRALALEDVEYLVYIEKPGPLELTVEKHGYDVYWINPATGESTVRKKFSGEHFTAEPPDRSHDWLLRVVREGRVESMNRSYKFASREIVLQEVEANSPKVPFAVEAFTGNLSISKAVPYSAKVTRESRATRAMLYLWMGEVAADHQGYRVLATGAKGNLQVPADIARNYPAVMHLRLYGMNANGKVYELDSAWQVDR